MEKPTEKINIQVTRMGNRWIGVLTENDKEIDRMACFLKSDIGWICREMLRWYDKLGGDSAWAKSARKRQTETPKPRGKVLTKIQLTKS